VCGKITSLNFKVNNKKTIRDTKIVFLDSETTTWEVLNHVVLKRISRKWCSLTQPEIWKCASSPKITTASSGNLLIKC
jgi:hypothetical protein